MIICNPSSGNGTVRSQTLFCTQRILRREFYNWSISRICVCIIYFSVLKLLHYYAGYKFNIGITSIQSENVRIMQESEQNRVVMAQLPTLCMVNYDQEEPPGFRYRLPPDLGRRRRGNPDPSSRHAFSSLPNSPRCARTRSAQAGQGHSSALPLGQRQGLLTSKDDSYATQVYINDFHKC